LSEGSKPRCGYCHKPAVVTVHIFEGVNQWIYCCERCDKDISKRSIESRLEDPTIEWWGIEKSPTTGKSAETIQSPTRGDRLWRMVP